MESTKFQDLAKIHALTGYSIQIRPHMTINSCLVSDDCIMLHLTIHRYTEAVSRTTLTAKGTKLISWTRLDGPEAWSGEQSPDSRLIINPEDGSIWRMDEIVQWDDTFEPVQLHQVGRIETPAEYHARRRWEAQTYRVGTDKSPMDNADVSADPKMPMYNYWMKG